MLIKIQPDATACRYLFTAKSLYMFRVSWHPSSGVLKTVTAASGTVHNIGTATSLQRGLTSAKSLYMLWVSQHPSSGVLKTVTATAGTGHNTGTATSLQHGLIRPRREVAAPEAAVTVFSTPDDGCCDTRNM